MTFMLDMSNILARFLRLINLATVSVKHIWVLRCSYSIYHLKNPGEIFPDECKHVMNFTKN